MATAADTNRTPERTKPPGDGKLKTTPSNKGLAAVGRDIGTGVDEVRPWITQDIKKFSKCPIDDMLKAFLADCVDDESVVADPDVLFHNSLDEVIKVCNGTVNYGVKSADIKGHLEEYSKSNNKDEVYLYPLFVAAANKALVCLQSVDVPGIRKAGSSRLCFHVNDPLLIRQTHHGHVSLRKPDVVVVSESDAREVLGEEGQDMSIDDILFKTALGPRSQSATKHSKNKEKGASPQKSFEWRGVRTFVEFKTSRSRMADPPQLYSTQAYTPPPKRLYLTVEQPQPSPPAAAAASAQSAVPQQAVRKSGNIPADPGVSRATRSSSRNAAVGANAHLAVPQQSAPGQVHATRSAPNILKRPSEEASSGSKRQKTEPKTRDPAIVQAGSYAAEMLAAYAARQHAIGLVVLDDLLYVWRYDRQGAIQCSALNFIQDLPRFLVLLLAMQRFKDCHWGLHPNIDPKFATTTPSYTTTLPGKEGKEIDITLDLSSEERVTSFCLGGRATHVFPATSKAVSVEDPLIAKVFWAEESRKSEPDILEKVYEIAQGNPDVKDHVPDMVSHKAYPLTSTSAIRKRLGLDTNGSRALYLIIFRKLKPITELDGDKFLQAWLDTVKCHLVLWKNDVRHRDVSPSNLMYRIVNGKIMGVLNDFDLASIGDGVTGTERTGTLPFMAIALLRPEAGSGQISHLYEHDAESFIWVLVWVALRYDKGELRQKDRPFDKWLTVDADTCYKEKSAFQCDPARWDLVPGAGHERNLDVANMCLNALLAQALAQNMPIALRPVLDIDTVYQQLIAGPLESFLKPTN